MINVLFRADASLQSGTGHIMRCLSLAEALKDAGCAVSFACRTLPQALRREIQRQSYEIYTITDGDGSLSGNALMEDAAQTCRFAERQGAHWIVVDNYDLDACWEGCVRGPGRHILVIDDWTNRKHLCDMLLNQNLREDADTVYNTKVPGSGELLLGPRYALLRRQFRETRRRTRPRTSVRRILVSFGGSDTSNETAKALTGIAPLVRRNKLLVDVVLGTLFPYGDEIRKTAAGIPGVQVHTNVRDMDRRMEAADLSLGAGGTSNWERCCLGLPALVALAAENQRQSTEALQRQGCVRCLGKAETLTPADYLQALEAVGEKDLREMSARGMNLVDGDGCLRVVKRMQARLERGKFR